MASPFDCSPGRRLTSVAAAGTLFTRLAASPSEIAGIAYVSAGRRILGLRLIRGGCDWVDVAARTLAVDALQFGAHGLVMAHNHPSGDPTPSAHDLAHARGIVRALAALEVRVLDHLVVAGDRFVSLRALGVV